MSSAATTTPSPPERSAFGPLGLRVDGPISYEAWETLGYTLGDIAKATPWLIGDWVVLGEALFGTRSAQAIDIDLGVKPETILKYGNVARLIAPADRRKSLSWYAHSQVAWLPPKERSAWLDKAEKGAWDSTRLRAELAAADALPSRRVNPSVERANITPREVLTMLKNDDTWADLARSALTSLDGEAAVELATCPACHHRWTL